MNDNAAERLNEIIADFNTGMLVTNAGGDVLNGRPMAVARHNEDSGALWFSTSLFTEKVKEIENNPAAAVIMQSTTQFVSLTGKAEISNDRGLIRDLFNKSWELWYPEGPAQSDIRLIKFTPSGGEYWDLSGTRGMSFVWEAGKALVSGTSVNVKDGAQHGEVTL